MGLTNPDIQTSKPFSEHFREGEEFTLLGVRIAEGVKTADFGEGDMVVLTIRISEDEKEDFGIWGAYLLEQARAAERSDFPARYRVVRKVVEGYSKREVKALEFAGDDDIPF